MTTDTTPDAGITDAVRAAAIRLETGIYTEEESAVDQDFKDQRALAAAYLAIRPTLAALTERVRGLEAERDTAAKTYFEYAKDAAERAKPDGEPGDLIDSIAVKMAYVVGIACKPREARIADLEAENARLRGAAGNLIEAAIAGDWHRHSAVEALAAAL